ncbi:MAG: hypothetical protein Q7S74_05905 [Nanoarchaeota archaeon]|nr:hypothetical protein [Nanoarchaeota archaeon]
MKKTIWIAVGIIIALILIIGGLFLFKQRETILNTNNNIINTNAELPFKDFLSSEEIRQYSDRIMISHVGQEDFMKYFKFQKAELIEPSNKDKRYVISYLINDYSAVIWLYTNGSIVVLDSFEHIVGVPNCIQDESKCVFIEQAKILEIAQKNNTSFKEASMRFGWSGDYNLGNETYIWEVSSKPTNSGDCTIYQSLIINANTGKILKYYPETGSCA